MKHKIHKTGVAFVWLVCLFIPAYFVVIGISVLVQEVVPVTRTHFVSYHAFHKYASPIFPKKLPESSGEIRYYYHKEHLKDQSGYHVVLSTEDYETMKAQRIDAYRMNNAYYYDGENKEYMDPEIMSQQQKIDFIDKLVSEEAVKGQYYFLGYYMSKHEKEYYYRGVLCNDETCEIVEFSCWIG